MHCSIYANAKQALCRSLASNGQSHGKMNSSWNSSPWLLDLTSFSAPLELVEHLWPADWSRLWASRTNKNVTRHWTADSNPVGAPKWPFLCQIQFTRVDHSSISSLSADFSTDYYRVCDHHNVVFKHSPLPTVLSGSNLSIPLDSSSDVSDVPISLFLANIRLQCKHCAYRPSYRCQQLRRNYIKYKYTLLRQPVLYLPIHAITDGQFTTLQPHLAYVI